MSLSPRDRPIAGLIFAVIFLSGGWTVSEVNRSVDRNKCDKEKQKLYKEMNGKESEILSLYDRLIEQIKSEEKLDSAIKDLRKMLKDEK